MSMIARLVPALLATLFAAGCSDSPSPSQHAGDKPRSDRHDAGHPRVIVVGIDGAEWDVIEQMMTDGELPGFRAMMDGGAHTHLLNPGPSISPVVWTTFATGHFPREHGILDFVHPYTETGDKQPVDAGLRREPALWNVLDARDRASTVIGYFVSHPAEPITGRMVSDRGFQGLERSVWPEDLEPLADRVRGEVRAETAEVLERFLPWGYSRTQVEDESSPYHEAAQLVEGRIDGRILADEFLRRMTGQLADAPAELFVTYFRIVDFTSHSAWYFHDPGDWETEYAYDPGGVYTGIDDQQRRDLARLIPESYRYVDEIIARLLEAHGGHSNIFVISDHGFGSATGEYSTGNWKLTGNHRPDGVLLAHGPDVVPGRIEPITIMEVFPTLAYLLDVPIADTIPGSVAWSLIDPALLDRREPQYVEAYRFDWSPVDSAPIDARAQREQMTELRGLGYIGEGVELGKAGGSDGKTDFWSSEPRLIIGALHGDIAYYLIRGDVDAAERVAAEIRRRAPDLIPPVLARVRSKIRWFRTDVPGASGIAPDLEAFIERQESLSGQ